MSKVLKIIASPFGLIGKGVSSLVHGIEDKNRAAKWAGIRQQRQSFAAMEDNAQVQAEQAASGRRLRGLGRRSLAYQGSELGVAPQLTGG